ncbi:MAG: putative porin [Bacteroidales bacterium]|nr:putative porin [Bacteroidales bacterium]
MKSASRILFPLCVVVATAVLSFYPMQGSPVSSGFPSASADTVIYPADAYKLNRRGNFEREELSDSILQKAGALRDFSFTDTSVVDSLLTPEQLEKMRKDSIDRADKAYRDSILAAKEDRKALRDSIIKATPRVLSTFALTDSMQFKRIIHWTVDQDFHNLNVSFPDTSYNNSFNDYPYLKRDVNATWLGTAGSPVQTYNYFKRDIADEGVEFYRAYESWAVCPSTLKQYNTKTPYTELAYYGTLFAGAEKESNNFHILTTQNFLPELNFTINFDKYGAKGMLLNQNNVNRNLYVTLNYLGKKYMMHTGYILNTVDEGENWGIKELYQVRDTTMEVKEILINNSSAKSSLRKHTFFLNQQLRIPFDFIHKIRHKKDSTYVIPEMDKDITSAFIGHSLEYSTYTRKYTDGASDSLRAQKLDNKVFLRLQPWSSDGIVSKLDVGLGDRLMNYSYGKAIPDSIRRSTENTVFLYAGVQGQVKKYFKWNAKAHYNIAGARIGDFDLNGTLDFNMYPFRRAKESPLSLKVGVSTNLKSPDFFQQHFYSNSLKWENTFGKTSFTKFSGVLDIPHWHLLAEVNYGLLANSVYYDASCTPQQFAPAVNVLSASLKKEFILGPLHLDNRVLFQTSSNQEVLPLPLLSLNLKYFVQFVVARDMATKTHPVLTMQFGVNAFYNTKWNSPGWNPVAGVFYNQREELYTNGPFFDVFINAQWKRACLFVKIENLGQGWPLKYGKDYFSAHRYIHTPRSFKIGIYWPFYMQPTPNKKVEAISSSK